MTVTLRTAAWLRWYTPPSPASQRLVCLPPAGSSASFYRTWAAYIPPQVAFAGIQYPGRENRLSERALEDMRELAEGVASAVRPLCKTSLALFGHSMGAAVAYEVALHLENPAVLFVSGCAPPFSYKSRIKKTWDDHSILAELKRLGGPNQSVLENSALLSLSLPALRADYSLIENYAPSTGKKLRCPVVAFCGDQDGEAPLEQMRQWNAVTTGPFRLSVFPGNHFFPLQRNQEVAAEILNTLTKVSRAAAPRPSET